MAKIWEDLIAKVKSAASVVPVDRRTPVAFASVAVSVLLIVGGIAFASQLTSPTTDQAGVVKKSTGEKVKDSHVNGKPGSSSRTGTSLVGGSTTTSTGVPATPTTIIGPNGEVITVPPPAAAPGTPSPAQPGGTPSSAPTTAPSAPPAGGTEAPTEATTTTIAPAAKPAQNGPANPSANVSLVGSTPEDPHLALNVAATDTDGFVSQISVDWGDGTVPWVKTYPLTDCTDSGNGSPSTSHAEAPDHMYTTASTYNIAVTVTSVSCDGSSPQQGLGSVSGVAVGGVSAGGADSPPTLPTP